MLKFQKTQAILWTGQINVLNKDRHNIHNALKGVSVNLTHNIHCEIQSILYRVSIVFSLCVQPWFYQMENKHKELKPSHIDQSTHCSWTGRGVMWLCHCSPKSTAIYCNILGSPPFWWKVVFVSAKGVSDRSECSWAVLWQALHSYP